MEYRIVCRQGISPRTLILFILVGIVIFLCLVAVIPAAGEAVKEGGEKVGALAHAPSPLPPELANNPFVWALLALLGASVILGAFFLVVARNR